MLPADLAQYKPLYLQTAWDYVRTLETNLQVLRTDIDNPEAAATLHLCAHSLKSQSLVMHFEHLGAVCYALERLGKLLKDGKKQLSPAEVEILFHVIEEIKHALAEISAHDTDIALDEVRSEVETMLGEGGST